MNNNETKPVDPFEDINLDDFRTKKKKKIKGKSVNAKTIKRVAEQENFQSRQTPPKKERIIPKTFSLFPSELDIVNSTLNSVLMYSNGDNPYNQVRPSGSDVVRAALHSFGKLSEEERIELVQEYRGRGRR